MELLITLIIILIIIIILKILFGYNLKKIEKMAQNKKLDELTQKYPSNIEICKYYLKKLNNETVTIEENKDTKTSLYIAITNKILIANISKSYTRIQTIAHECLHSIQDKKLLMFNFIFSNIYILYFLVISILTIFKILPMESMFLNILVILGFVQYLVKAYLENDAMIKARFLAKDYLEESGVASKEDITTLISQYDYINNVGIKCTNFNLFLSVMIKVLIFIILCLIF